MECQMQEAEFRLLVKQMTWESEGVLTLALAPGDGQTLPSWDPGAHIDVILDNGQVRQYSLCGSPDDPSSYRIAVLREPSSRGGSAYIHSQLRPGQTVMARGPRNHFKLLSAHQYIFIAGGIGVTPLLPMIASVEKAGLGWRLLYGGRSRAAMAFTGELSKYGSKVDLCPQDEWGLLDLDTWLTMPQPQTRVYCCGPETLIEAVEQRCQSWPEDSLQVERFAPKPIEAARQNSSFEVYCKATNVTVRVGPDMSVLQALETAGLEMPRSCEEGICGTCETRVLEGIPDHRDSILTAAERRENATMMICISRALSRRLVLDC
jgi:tetrachlorobenzoquinone reductase